jgi:hypothetical protein
MPILTSTHRYKCPPRKREPRSIEAPAIVTFDPKTRVAEKSRRVGHTIQGIDQRPVQLP